MKLKEAIRIIETAIDHEATIPLEYEVELAEKLASTSSYVREYIINHVDTRDRIVHLEPLVSYLEDKLEQVMSKYEDTWSGLSFKKKEKIYADAIGEEDFEHFKKMGWVKDL